MTKMGREFDPLTYSYKNSTYEVNSRAVNATTAWVLTIIATMGSIPNNVLGFCVEKIMKGSNRA